MNLKYQTTNALIVIILIFWHFFLEKNVLNVLEQKKCRFNFMKFQKNGWSQTDFLFFTFRRYETIPFFLFFNEQSTLENTNFPRKILGKFKFLKKE